MRAPRMLFPFLLLATTPLLSQEACPVSPGGQRRLAQEILQSPAVREVIREGRSRVLHSFCGERDKDSRREVLTSIVYNYAANLAVRLVIDPASRQLLAAERMTSRPQTSAEERQEAFRLVRDKLDLGTAGVVEGGFVVDPPEGAPPAGRYVQVQVLSPDRWKLREFVVVDLSREVVVARRPR